MKKNLLLTCLSALVATFGFAQTTQWPITLTTADGLPGTKIVRNYSYQSKTYTLDEAVSTLRFTVISTNTVDSLTSGSFDGYSQDWGTGFPFFTMSEFRIYDGNGKQIEYVASGNAVAPNDGGGIYALSDKNEGTYLHTVYSRGPLPHAYHYLEFELAEPVSSFSFNWNTRSDYHKNLITYMGITPGTLFLPYPEQEFQLGEQVTSVDQLAEEGALFVLRSNSTADYTYPDFDRSGPVLGQIYMHSPCGGDETPNAAQLVYLTPDANVENGYKVTWLNNGHHMIKPELNGGWFQWTNDELNAGTVTFAPCDTLENAFSMTMGDDAYIIAYDAIGKMALVGNDDESKGNRSHPNTYNWNIYKASINGAAIASQLQEEIDNAERRIAEVGGKVEGYDEGEYDALIAALDEAKAIVSNEGVKASEIITTKRSLNLLKAAYAAVGIWSHLDSIDYITAAVEAGDIVVSEAPDWVEGSYNKAALANLVATSEAAMQVVDTYQSLADVDAAIASIYAAIDGFWAAKVSNVKTLPFRVGTTEDGLPGTMQGYGGYLWESPMYNLTGEVETIRFTYFKTNNNGVYSGTPYVFPTFGEIEFYDASGNKIALTAESFTSNAIMTRPDNATGDYQGYAALVDGNTGTHAHATWGSGQVPDYDANPTYMWLEVTFPEPISSFKYVQYGRKNGVNTPTDFVIGESGFSYTPDDVELPDFYNTKVGDVITDASQITDDGIYALEGLLNCAPESDGSGYAKYYSANLAFGTKIAASCAFSVRKTGAEDGSFYIQSLADGSYWSQTIDDDGWGANSTTMKQAEAGKFIIAPANRAEYGKAEFANTFVLYMYNDTVKRNDTPHPYIVAQDWGDKIGYFSIDSLKNNDWDGEGEWRIYKLTMDNPYLYWLKNAVAAATAMGVEVGPDPGYYSQESAGAYATALAKAQNALATNNEAIAKAVLPELEAAVLEAGSAELNPVVEGIYVFESAYRETFIASTGSSKYICTYFNDFEAYSPNCTSEYSLWWVDAPEGKYKELPNRYKFQLISATNSEKVQNWLEDETIDSVHAANAYFIKSIEVGQYAGTSVDGARSQDIGLTVDPEEPYIIRSQGAYLFDIWHPSHGNASLHMEGNSGGKGTGGDIVYWSGSDKASQWYLRRVDRADINTLSIKYINTEPGHTVTLPISMSNESEFTAFQMDIELPEEVTFVSATLNNERATDTHTIISSKLANGKQRIIAYSNSNSLFKQNEGTLLNIKFEVPVTTPNADYNISISNIRISKANTEELKLADVKSIFTVNILKGDANNDKNVTVSDVVAVANYILEKIMDVFKFDAADINNDGNITIGDLVAIVNIILSPDDIDYNGKMAKRGVMAESGSAISMPDTRSIEGTATVPVSLNNTTAYTAFQMDVELPEGATLASATLCDRAAGHNIAWSKLPDGKMRVVAYSISNGAINGNAGELIALNIKAEKAVNGAINVDNVRMVTPAGAEYILNSCGSLLDINGTTNIGTTEAGSLKIYTAGGALVIESDKAMQTAVYSMNGKLIQTINVVAGKNIYSTLPAGTYVVAGVKVIIK